MPVDNEEASLVIPQAMLGEAESAKLEIDGA